MKVFLSSTYQDLVAERDAVYQALQGDYEVIRMEDFGTQDEVPIEVCLEAVEGSEVYVLLLGHRYGTLQPEYGMSYTHIEYERARQCGLPVLAYFKEGIDEAAGTDIRLETFANDVNDSHTLQHPYFASPQGLAEQVAADLRNNQDQFRTRPYFGRYSKAIDNPLTYAIGGVRRARLRLHALIIVVADVAVLNMHRYPEGRGRRMRDKVNAIQTYLEAVGANVVVMNQLPATRAESVVEQRVREVSGAADFLVCLVRGETDAENLVKLLEADAAISVWHPDRMQLDLPDNVLARPYSASDLQDCQLALDVQDYLSAVIDEHLGRSLA